MSLFYPLDPKMLSIEDANRLSEKLVFALDLMMGAYERRIRSDCTTPEQLATKPWECAEWSSAAAAVRAYRHREFTASENPLALAIIKFAPDLAIQLKERWEAAQANGDKALNEFLAFLRGGHPCNDCPWCGGVGAVGIPGARCEHCDGSGKSSQSDAGAEPTIAE